MAAHASLGLDRSMLVHERPTRFCMALDADCILIGRGLDVVVPKGAVRIMAVGAFDQALIHLVVEGHVECCLGVGMALEAECRLLSLEQRRIRSRLMHGVAAGAAY